MLEDFDNLPLHDATLRHVVFDWAARTLRLELSVFYTRDARAVPSALTFSGVRDIAISRTDPWGPSSLVNGTTLRPPDWYKLEIQSGDSIEVHADAFKLERTDGSP